MTTRSAPLGLANRLEETRSRFLERALAQARRLGELVKDLIALSRVETHDPALEREPVDLRGPVADSVREHAAEAETRSLVLSSSLPSAATVVLGHPEDLRQAVDNPLANAIRYTPERGRISERPKLQALIGWKPTISLDQTIDAVAERMRARRTAGRD